MLETSRRSVDCSVLTAGASPSAAPHTAGTSSALLGAAASWGNRFLRKHEQIATGQLGLG